MPVERERGQLLHSNALKKIERGNSRRVSFMFQDKAHNRLHHPNPNVNTEEYLHSVF